MAALPLTYPDLVCDPDVDPYARETTSDLQNLVQDVAHVLKQRLGSNPDDPTRGIGIEDYLSGTTDAFTSLVGLIEVQMNQDPRITGCSCAISPTDDGTFTIQLVISVAGSVVPLTFGWQSGNFTNLTGA